MRQYSVKIPDDLAQLFEGFLKEEGKSPYIFLKEQIYSYLVKKGIKINEPPLSVRVQILEREVEEIKKQLQLIIQKLEQQKEEKKGDLAKYFKK